MNTLSYQMRSLVFLLAISLATTAFAANQTWLGAGGGSGTWNATATNWDSGAAWTANNTAVFGGTAGNVTLSATAQAVGGLTFNVGGYTLSNGTLALNGAPTTIATNGGTTTFASTLLLSGAAGSQITKTGSGILSLNISNPNLGTTASNSVWTITGGTLSNGVYDSELSISAGNNLGALPASGAVQVILDAGTLVTAANISGNRSIQVNAAGGTIQINTNNTVDGKIFNSADGNRTLYAGVGSAYASSLTGVISGNGSMTKIDAGKLTLTGSNTYTGNTTVLAGVLNIQNATSLGSAGNGTAVSSGAALQIQGGIAVGSEALTLSGTGISNDGALRNISGNNTYGGLVTLAASTRINSDADTLTLGNNGTITGSGFGLTVGGAGNTTIAGIIGTGNGTVTKDGSGKLVLFSTSSAGNTFTGGVFLNSGTLGVYEGSSLGQLPVSASTQLTFTGNSTLQFQATPVNSYNGNRKMAINTGVAATFDTQGFSAGIDGIISGSTGSLVKIGSGTLTLRGNNTYGGGTTISVGTLTLGNANALGSATGALKVDGGNLNLGSFTVTAGALTSLNGTFSGFTLGTNSLTVSSASVSGTNYIGISNAATASVGAYNLINSSGGGLTGAFQFSGAQDLTVPVNSIIAKTSTGYVRLTLNNTGTAEQVVVSNSIPPNTINIMPLGASITFGVSTTGTAKNGDVITSYSGGGYHTQLYQSLVNDGRFNPNFVGSNTGLGAVNANGTNILTTANQTASEGHAGYKTSQILYNLNHNDGAASANGGFWLSANNTATSGANSPTYVPLNVGGNDFADASNRNTSVVNRYDAIISELNTLRPGVATIVGSLTYRTDVGSYQNTYFNPYVPGIVYNHVLAGHDVRFLDFYTLLSPNNSMNILSSDGIHPTQAGYNMMANAWYESTIYGAAYWKGGQDGNWSTVNGTNTNWAMNRAGTIDRQTSLTDPTTRTNTGAYADVFFNSNNSTLSTTVDADTTVRSLNFTSGATGAVSIGGNNTLTIGAGGITVQQGTGAHDVSANVVLGADQTWGNVSTNNFTVSGMISGSGNLTVAGGYSVQTAGAFTSNASTSFEIVATNTSTFTGTGKIILSGNNTYTGMTTVTSGTLIINGSTSASSAVIVSAGATLGGNGTVGGFTTVNGDLKPGNSPGVLTFSAGLTLNGTTTMEINGTTTPGTDFDKIVVSSGTTTFGGALVLSFGSLLSNSTTINLFSFPGTSLGNFSGVTSTGSYNGAWSIGVPNDTWTLSSGGGQVLTFSEVTGNLNVVPEPSTWALLAFSLTTVMVLRRRRE